MSDTIEATTEADELRDKIAELEDELKDLRGELDAETERADAAESEADAYRARVEELEGRGVIHQLADVRKAIKSGRSDDAVYRLEKAMDEMDGGTRIWWTL